MFIVNQAITHLITLRRWSGRAGLLVLSERGLDDTQAKLAVCNFHGGHGDDLIDSLSDLRNVTKFIPHQCTKVLCGDYNIDLLPTDRHDPYKAELGRRDRHHRERELLEHLLARVGVNIVRPTHYVSAALAFTIPFGLAVVTRRPADIS